MPRGAALRDTFDSARYYSGMSETTGIPLSELAKQILSAGDHPYEKLVTKEPTPQATIKLLDGVKPEQLITGDIKHWPNAWAMLAGLWLWHDGLEECHRIVQKDPLELLPRAGRFAQLDPNTSGDLSQQQMREATKTFAFWHAIMHRREGDFSNSKYWYAKAAGHPVLTILAHQVGAIVNQLPADRGLLKIIATGWNPDALVDFAESVRGDPASAKHGTAVALQKLEWRTLFEFCTR
jgi:hypothetical protein